MAKTNRKSASAKTARTSTSNVPANITSATTVDALVAYVRAHVTVASFVTFVVMVRTTFADVNAGLIRRNVGRTSNRRIVDFQNWTFASNVDWKLDDVQIAALWLAEFPYAVGRVFRGHPADVIGIVRSVRAQCNGGTHDNTAPSTAYIAYGDTAAMKPAAMFPRPSAPMNVAPSVVVPTVPASAHNPAKRGTRLVRKSA